MQDQWQWLLTAFALTLLHRGLRKGALSGRSQEGLPMLDDSLRSRHPSVASLSLRCLAALLSLPLPGALPLLG